MSLNSQFETIKRLGEGSFANVYKVKRKKDEKIYALKKVKMPKLNKKEKENALNEVRILASIDDPYIVQYHEAFYDQPSSCLCVIMEFAGGGDLLGKITKHKPKRKYFQEKMIWRYFIQMIKGLKTLHDMKILHRDMKCANVFISTDGKSIKLGDMNVSKVAKRELVKTQTGTPYYASPEVWKDQPYGTKSDIWSLGCVLYEMVALQPPFQAQNMNGLYNKVLSGKYDKIPSIYSWDLARVIGKLLQVNPSKRPSCDDLLKDPIIEFQIQKDEELQSDKFCKKAFLLDTIQLPQNLLGLKANLPKPNYSKRRRLPLPKSTRASRKSYKQLNPLQDKRMHQIQNKQMDKPPMPNSHKPPMNPNLNKKAKRPPMYTRKNPNVDYNYGYDQITQSQNNKNVLQPKSKIIELNNLVNNLAKQDYKRHQQKYQRAVSRGRERRSNSVRRNYSREQQRKSYEQADENSILQQALPQLQQNNLIDRYKLVKQQQGYQYKQRGRSRGRYYYDQNRKNRLW